MKKKKKKPMKKKKKKLGRHPWDEWFKQEQFTLRKGKDFSGMVHSMSVQVRNAAIKRDLVVSVKIHKNTLLVEKVGYYE